MTGAIETFVQGIRSGLLTGDGDAIVIELPNAFFTRAQFRDIVAELVVTLRSAGVGRGSTVVYQFPNTSVFQSALAVAAYLLGFSFVQAKQAIDCRDVGATHYLKGAESKELPLRGADGIPRVVFAPTGSAGNAAEIIGSCPGPESGDAIGPIMTSSGTTGMPKAIPIRFGDFTTMCTDVMASMPEVVRRASLFPNGSTVGIVSILISLTIGGCYFGAFKAHAKQIAAFYPDFLIGSPQQLVMFMRERGPVSPDQRLPKVASSGGLLTAPLAQALRQHFDVVSLMYGATEVGGVANLIVGPDYRPGIVGVPSPTCDVEIVGSDDQPLPAGEVGQIRLRSKSMCHGYLGDSREHNEKAFRDGWFYPGDFGRLLPDGRLQIEGRDTDHLNIGGVKVNALLIDEIMASAEGVQDAACFLLPGQFGVGQLAAMLVHEDGYDAETVKKNIAAAFEADPRSRPAMFPRQVFSTNKVPRNENGKVMRHVATRLAQQAM